MENKYQQGKIYKIVCNITSEVYYGSTIETLNDRLSNHKYKKNCICRNIIERGNYKIELIKDYPCNSKYELEEEECKYIRENECINIAIPHRTKKEWYQDNKEKISEKQKEWREDNKEKYKEYDKNRNRNNYEKNKDKLLEKVKCECGVIITKSNIRTHRKTKKHIKLLEEKYK